jgi:hypothetical protein
MGDAKRDSEVVRMRKEGISRKQICEHFGISRSRVRQIISASRLEEQQRERSRQMLQTLRSTNTIDKKWPKEIIMECFRLPKVFAWRLERHFQKENILELSLRDLMDFLISRHIEAGQNIFQVMPALTQFNVGWKTYAFLVRCLSQQDLGETFNTAWAMRIANVVRYLQRTHAYVPSVLVDIAISLGLTSQSR